MKIERLRKRSQFLAIAKSGRKWVMPGVVLQVMAQPENNDLLRLGFTASSKVGSAVVRNRARRRLRETARQVVPLVGKPGYDIVLIAREGTLKRSFDQLKADIEVGLVRTGASK